MDISPDSVSHKFVTKFSDVLFTKFGDLENSSPNLVINPSQNLTLNTLKLIPHCILLCILVNTLWLTLTDCPIPTLASMSNKGLSSSRNILWSLDLSQRIWLSEFTYMLQGPAIYCLVWSGSDQAAEICWEIMQCVDDPDLKIEDT